MLHCPRVSLKYYNCEEVALYSDFFGYCKLVKDLVYERMIELVRNKTRKNGLHECYGVLDGVTTTGVLDVYV